MVFINKDFSDYLKTLKIEKAIQWNDLVKIFMSGIFPDNKQTKVTL